MIYPPPISRFPTMVKSLLSKNLAIAEEDSPSTVALWRPNGSAAAVIKGKNLFMDVFELIV